MTPKPCTNLVIVTQEDIQRMSPGGIHIPDRTAAESQIGVGIVIEVGPGRYSAEGKLIPMRRKKGERVCFNKMSLVELELNTDQKLFIINEDQILAVIESCIDMTMPELMKTAVIEKQGAEKESFDAFCEDIFKDTPQGNIPIKIKNKAAILQKILYQEGIIKIEDKIMREILDEIEPITITPKMRIILDEIREAEAQP